MAAGDRLKDGTYQILNCSSPSSAPLALNSNGAMDRPTQLIVYPVDGTDAEQVVVCGMRYGVHDGVQRMHMPAEGLTIDASTHHPTANSPVITYNAWADSKTVFYDGYSGAYLAEAQEWDIIQTGRTWSCKPTIGDLWKGDATGQVYSDSGDTYYWNGTHWIKQSDLSVASFSTVLYPKYKILFANDNTFCLEIASNNGVFGSGSTLDINQDDMSTDTSDDYQWIFVPRSTIPDGVYNIVTAMQNDALMEPSYGGTGSGTYPMVGFNNSDIAYQTFMVNTTGAGTYIRPTFNTTDYYLCRRGTNDMASDGPHFWHGDYAADGNALFILEPEGVIPTDANNSSAPGFRIVSQRGQAGSGCLDVWGQGTQIGNKIGFHALNNTAAQRFDFVPALPLDKTLPVPVVNGGSVDGKSVISSLMARGANTIFPAFTCAGKYFTIRYKVKPIASNDGYIPTGNNGRNLISNSAGPWTNTYPSSSDYFYRDGFSPASLGPLTQTEYTLSFTASSTVAGDKIHCYFYAPNTTIKGVSPSGTTTRADGDICFTLTKTPTRYWVHYTQTPTSEPKHMIIARTFVAGKGYDSGSGTITYSKVKLEEGVGATDWTPAPEDVNNGIATYSGSVSLNDNWLNILTGKLGNHGWGTSGTPDVQIDGENAKICTRGIPVNLSSSVPLIDVEYEVALWSPKCTQFNIAGRGSGAVGHIKCIYEPTVTITSVVFAVDGIRVAYSSDVVTSSNTIVFSDPNLLTSDYSVSGKSASGSVTIPYSYLGRIPSTDIVADLKCTFTTCDGGSSSSIFTGTIGFNASHGMTLAPTIAGEGTPWHIIESDQSTALYYILIHKGHADRLVYLGTGKDVSVFPPLGVSYRIFGIVQSTDGTQWGTWSKEFEPIIETPGRYHWDFSAGRATLIFNTDRPGPTFSQSMTTDSTPVKVAGREHDLFTFGSDVSNVLDVTGIIADGSGVPSGIPQLPYSTRDCFDALAYSKHALFRSPDGFWAEVAITGYTIVESTQDIPAVTIKQSEETR